jgi:hypothetical protein
MTPLIREATLSTAGCLLIASAAMACDPQPATSTITCINLVGTAGGVVDPNAPVTWTIRDASGNPVPNASVTINFSTCVTQDISLGSSQPDPGMVVNCTAKTITKVANGSGRVTFRIVGSANNLGNESGHGVGCASIQANGVPMGSVTVSAFDQNLTGSVSSADLSRFAVDFYGANFRARSDHNCTGTVTSSDLARFAIVFYGNGSTEPISYCP